MIANREDCMTAEELAALLAGRLPAERFAGALEHVETCPACAATATASALPEFSWAKRSATPDCTSHEHEPECQAVVGQLLLQPGSRSHDSDRHVLPVETLGPYRLIKWLGSGGMGAVYLAEHQRLKRLTAVKLLPRDKLQHSGWLERFNREMTSIAALEHPHVVRAIDAGDQGGWHYLVMEYLDGADLSQVCRCVGQLPIPTACELARQAALGLAAIHELGMTHRDIKPSNLFLTRQGVVKLLDLGLVLSGDSPLAADERLTTVGHLMGTLPYMAREQLLDASEVDWRADIYSLGATLFRFVTGQAPFGSAKNLARTIREITTNACPPIQTLQPDVPRELAELIERMLSHDRERRPQSAKQVAEELTAFCDAESPKSLVRTVLGQIESMTKEPGSELFPSLTMSPAPLSAPPNRPPLRWALWLAAALGPIAFLAGIVITVATDKGTLVIESEQPGVTVKVTQGDKLVESLKVENQPGFVRLYSGKYVVELVGAEGDGLILSDAQVTVTRGAKELLRVHRRTQAVEREPSSGRSFQGKSFAYWLDCLERDTDVAIIAQAMQAVAVLAETDEQKLAAAKMSLIPARRLGGFRMAGRRPAQPQNQANNSEWYMLELIEGYPRFMPEPGLEAIIQELEQGNARSAWACLMILVAMDLYGFDANTPHGAEYDVKLAQHLKRLPESESGRGQLMRLKEALQKTSEQFRSAANVSASGVDATQAVAGKGKPPQGDATAIQQAVEVSKFLKEDLSVEPSYVKWAEAQVAEAESRLLAQPRASIANGQPVEITSPLNAYMALTIAQVLKDTSSMPVLLGLLEVPSYLSEETDKELTVMLERFATEHPQETAAAIVKHFERMSAADRNIVWSALRPDRGRQRVTIANRVLLANVQDRKALADTLTKAQRIMNPQSIYTAEDIADLLKAVK